MLQTIIAYDTALFERLNALHSPFWDHVFHIITQFGSGWVAGPLLAACIWYLSPRQSLKKHLLTGAIIMVSCGILNSAVKKSIRRARPLRHYRQAESTYHVHTVGKRLKNRRSFPSGHTLTAFGAAALLAGLYGGMFNLAYLFALLVGYSRIYAGVHFPLDVAAGAASAVIYTLAGLRIAGISTAPPSPRHLLRKAD